MKTTLTLCAIALFACSQPTAGTNPPEPLEAAEPVVDLVLQASNGRYVCLELREEHSKFNYLLANRETPGAWETFVRIPMGEGRWALRASNGKFVCADRAHGGVLVADRGEVGDWETFEEVPLADGRIAIRTTEGKFVCADQAREGDEAGLLVANRDSVSSWESFTVTSAPAPIP